MPYLIVVSTLWAFSFGLIGTQLSDLDSSFLAASRLLLAALVLMPFFRPTKFASLDRVKLLVCGAIQFGLMYLCLFAAFRYLHSHQVALFTIFTPLYIYVLYDLSQRRFHRRYLLAALLAILGAAVIRFSTPTTGADLLTGFLIVQVANLAFASGQLYYRQWKRNHPDVENGEGFAFLFLGGFAFSGLWVLASTLLAENPGAIFSIRPAQIPLLCYLGIVASGLGFFLWNKGATLVSAGRLAAANNLVVPLAVLVSLVFFGELSDLGFDGLLRLICGGALITSALWIGKEHKQPLKVRGQSGQP